MIVLTRDELVGLGACDPGLTWFDTHAPSGRVEFPDLTALRVWASLLDGAPYVRWLLTTADKSHRGASLAGAELAGAELEGARLGGADLSGARLSGARLTGARLAGAHLVGADLTDADLSCATLASADLTDADLSGATLTSADLSGALRLPTDPPIPGWGTYTDGNVTRLKRTA